MRVTGILEGAGEKALHPAQRGKGGLFGIRAGQIRNDPELLQLFRTHDSDAVSRLLPVRFNAELNRFLAQYGCRSRHRTLYIKRWAEAPQEVIGILQALAQRQYNPTAVAERTAAVDGSDRLSERSLLSSFLLAMTRKFLDLREELRFLLDEALFEIRKALLEVGGHTGLGDAVLFLELDELEQLAAGETTLEDMRRLAETRRSRFLQGGSASSFLVAGRPRCLSPVSTLSEASAQVPVRPAGGRGLSTIRRGPTSIRATS